MNKKADISITILVIGVVAACGLAIFSFYSSGISMKSDFFGLEIIEKINSISEEIEFYENSDINKDPFKIMDVFTQGISQNNIVFTGVKETRNEKENYILTGTYSIEECEYWIVSCEPKILVWIEYKK
tara:strand:+ start:68 stop:451 length:384 start_codon:yes stop_codon:yes gene_type:complete